MLIELRIRDYAVIDDLTLEVGPGLSALSGETGAGKSIIVGALSLLLGERASSDVVRAGADRALVEAVFDVSMHDGVKARIEELGIETEDGLLILRREVAAAGRNRAWINGSPTTAGIVGELGRALVDLHGQHEHQTLLRQETQRSILDAFAGAEGEAAAVAQAFDSLSSVEKRLGDLQARRREIASRVDFLRFQLGELTDADLGPDEDVLLEEESRRLEHSEELLGEATRIHTTLYAGEGALTERLSEVERALARLKAWDASLEAPHEALKEAYHALAQVGRDLGDYAEGVSHDPGRLAEIQERLDLIHTLMRKYGPSLSEVLESRERLAAELDELEGGEWDEGQLTAEVDRQRGHLAEVAARLTALRKEGAHELESAAEVLLPDLGLPGATFQIALETLPEIRSHGDENVEFLISVNAGFAPTPLARVASGGELSRVMLALKAILARVDQVPTLVFDEIDAGIGGQVASLVAQKLKDVARYHQVFVVTHLPQIACRAGTHLFVKKNDESGLAATSINALTGEVRVQEIARMLGGDADSKRSQDHARELLEAG
jgi:DNA repair protein RecN (Recombination protein N)